MRLFPYRSRFRSQDWGPKCAAYIGDVAYRVSHRDRTSFLFQLFPVVTAVVSLCHVVPDASRSLDLYGKPRRIACYLRHFAVGSVCNVTQKFGACGRREIFSMDSCLWDEEDWSDFRYCLTRSPSQIYYDADLQISVLGVCCFCRSNAVLYTISQKSCIRILAKLCQIFTEFKHFFTT